MGRMVDAYSAAVGHGTLGMATGEPVIFGSIVGHREATERSVAFLASRAMQPLEP